ncbi:MAG TPA: regulatory protein RecX [Terriglobales bacterium]
MSFRKAAPRTYDEDSLYDYAVGALGRRMRTVAELKRLMRTRVGHQENGDALMDAVISRLKEQRYINDTQYAASYSAMRRDGQKFGMARVVQDLKARGVHGDVIAKTVPQAYEGVSEIEQARAYLARKRAKQPADDKQAARIFRMLVRAGFSSRSIIAVLRKWHVEDETLSALEQERAEAEETSGGEE